MFRIVSERTAWWPVTFAGVTEEGEVVENKIELRFRILDEDDVVTFFDELREVNEAAVQDSSKGTSAHLLPVMMQIVRDWRGVASENGQALPFEQNAFQELLKVPNVGVAIGAAYAACRRAAPELRSGN